MLINARGSGGMPSRKLNGSSEIQLKFKGISGRSFQGHSHDKVNAIGGSGICMPIYYIKLKSRPSVRLTVTPLSQQCQHRWKRDLLEMKAESSGTSSIFL